MLQILAESLMAPQAEYRAIAMNRMEDTFQSLTNQLQRFLAVYHHHHSQINDDDKNGSSSSNNNNIDTTSSHYSSTSSQEIISSQRRIIHRLLQQAILVLRRLGQLAEYPQAIELRQERLPLYQLQLETFQTHIIRNKMVALPQHVPPQKEEITFFFGSGEDDTSTTTTSSSRSDEDDDDDPTMRSMMQDLDGYSCSSGEFITLESSLKMDALLFTIE